MKSSNLVHYANSEKSVLTKKIRGIAQLSRQLIISDVRLFRREPLSFELKDRFSEALPEVELYAPEDTKMLTEVVESGLKRMSNPDLLIDLCSGDGIVPAQMLLDGLVPSALSIDIDIKKALDFKLKLSDDLPEAVKKISIKEMNILKSDLKGLISYAHGKRQVLLSANPPWIPVPDINSFKYPNKYKDSLLAINGGVDGLKFYRRIFSISDKIGVDKIAINIPSIVDISGFKKLLEDFDFEIEFINLLNTFSYGFDAIPEVQGHFMSFSGNCHRKTSDGKIQYLLMGMVLKKGRGKAGLSFDLLDHLFAEYKSFNLFSNKELQLKRRGFCKLWHLSDQDRIRICR